MTSPSSVSVIVPVRNGAPELRACIGGILEQTVRPREIIVIDSGSTDSSLDIVREYPVVSIVEITSKDFNHGETRNLGVRLATSETVLMTVQDARPASKTWISDLLAGMTDDDVAGTCGAQIVPHERDKNPVEWYRPQSQPVMQRFQFNDAADFLALPAHEKRRICAWDNVTALYRRDALLELPFRKTHFGEDMLWARDAIIAGWALVYNPAARVFHYHNETAEFAFRRALASLYYRYVSTGDVPPSPSAAGATARVVKTLLRESEIPWAEKTRWLRYNLRNQRAVRRAVRRFRDAVSEGDAALEDLNDLYAGTSMVPAKSSSQLPD